MTQSRRMLVLRAVVEDYIRSQELWAPRSPDARP